MKDSEDENIKLSILFLLPINPEQDRQARFFHSLQISQLCSLVQRQCRWHGRPSRRPYDVAQPHRYPYGASCVTKSLAEGQSYGDAPVGSKLTLAHRLGRWEVTSLPTQQRSEQLLAVAQLRGWHQCLPRRQVGNFPTRPSTEAASGALCWKRQCSLPHSTFPQSHL